MHPHAMDGVGRMLALARFEDPPRQVLDVGGADVNGTVHALVRESLGGNPEIDVLDTAPGRGVTFVGDATSAATWITLAQGRVRYDLVLCTEVLEHVHHWAMLLAGARWVLRPGGWLIGSCAAPGRRPHGARGERRPPPGEWYGNVPTVDLLTVLHNLFPTVAVESYVNVADRPSDLYWAAQA